MSVIITVMGPLACSYLQPIAKSRKFTLGGIGVGSLPLPTDPVGSITVTLSGVKPGSEIKLIDKDKNVLGGTESLDGVAAFNVNYYAPGSPNNVIRILIISLGYEVIDLAYTLPNTSITIPVFQRIDRNYRNQS